MAGECDGLECCKVPVCLNFICAEATDEFKSMVRDIICDIITNCGCEPGFGCPDQTGDMVTLCYEDAEIIVPQAAVKTMLAQGATCGSCDERCCPDQTGKKIDMCLNGNTINVSRNACPGIINAGGTCGACPV